MDNSTEEKCSILVDLISRFKSMREFARTIGEDPADVLRWRDKKNLIQPRAAITIIRLFGIKPHDLRPDIFPEHTKITFTK
jgi:DNA-binding transcriptional regulator YdaS (Cro superfamily)